MSELIISGRVVETSVDPVQTKTTSIGKTQYFILKIEVLEVLKGEISERTLQLISPKISLRPGVMLTVPLTNPELDDRGKDRLWFLKRSKEMEGFYSLVHVETIFPTRSLTALIKSVMAILELKEADQIAELVKWLPSYDAGFVRTAVEMLERRRAKAAVNPLALLLKSQDNVIREMAYHALLRINSLNGNLILIRALEQNLGNNFDLEAMSLLIYDFQDRKVIPVLIAALDHRDPQIKVAAMEKLAEFRVKEVIDRLLTELKSPEKYLRFAAYRALAKIGDKRALPYLEEALKTAPEEEKLEIQSAIREIKKQAR